MVKEMSPRLAIKHAEQYMRVIVGILTFVIASFIVIAGLCGGLGGRWPDLLLNLGTELFGIVLTVLIIDWLFERRDIQKEARRLAVGFLNRLDHHVWVWQGGAREFDLTETLNLLSHVTDDDPLPEFTQNLLLVLGSNAADRARYDLEVVAVDEDLKTGLEELGPLTNMRSDHGEVMFPTAIAEHLKRAALALATAAEISIPEITYDEPEYRNPSIESQAWRHYGVVGHTVKGSQV